MMEIARKNYTVIIEDPVMHVDNEARHRSGHMSHAMTEFAPNCFIDFNANYSAVRKGGHYCYGWVEYCISRDGGKTYSELQEFPYSRKSFEDGLFTISVEKAVTADDGTILAFCLRNSALAEMFCVPWETPTVVRSHDQGKTWEEADETCFPYKGRIYDAFVRDGVIYVLQFCNDYMWGSTDEHKYRLYKSFDNGKTFVEISVIPFTIDTRSYGAMIFDAENVLHTYVYIKSDELHLDHAISKDEGKTWEIVDQVYVDQAIRNPQIELIDGVYVMHGRSHCLGDEGQYPGDSFVLYTSEDAYHWNEAIVMVTTKSAGQFYSENLKLTDENGSFLLVQYSEVFSGKGFQVNVKHLKLRIKR